MLLGSVVVGVIYFYTYVVSNHGPVDLAAPNVWLGLLTGSSPALFACFFSFVIWTPVTIKIDEESISYRICISRSPKKIQWKDVCDYKKTLTGVKIFTKSGSDTVSLYLFSSDSRLKIQNYISNKVGMA